MMSTKTEPHWPTIEEATIPYTFNESILPPKVRESLDRFAHYGVPTGGFLRAVLANDLRVTLILADEDNIQALPAICLYVYNCLPSECWGSREIVKQHIDHWFPLSTEWFQEHTGDGNV